MKKVDIYIREKNGNREIRIPILPEEIKFDTGEATFISFDIMNLGEVAVASGRKLSALSWESNFPGEDSPEVPNVRGSWASPETYHNILKDWKEKRTLLNVLITCSPINKDVYVETYAGSLTGAHGSIYYELSLLEHRKITIQTSTESSSSPSTDRETEKSSSYTIKKGDTLWDIAAMPKHYGNGAKWKLIYNANKDIIEKTAKKYGRKSSSNGHWIYPGVTLTIPDAN